MTIQEILKELTDTADKILANSGSAGQLTDDNLGNINNDACDIIYYLNMLKENLKTEQK